MVKIFDALVFGDVCCDLIFTGLPSFPKPGQEIWAESLNLTLGGAMNTPVALSRLGLNVGVITSVGTNFWGDFIKAKFMEEDISYEFIHVVKGDYDQVSVAINYEDDRAFVSYGDKSKTLEYQEHAMRIINSIDAKIMHFYLSPMKGHLGILKKAKEKGGLISLDCGWDPEFLRSEEAREQIKVCDIFFPNLIEAQVITGKARPSEVLKELSKLCPIAVVKMANNGAMCISKGRIYYSPTEIVELVDSTGAGDNFVAGFLYSYLDNQNIEDSLKAANICGANAVTKIGGSSGALTKKELEDKLRSKELVLENLSSKKILI